MPSTKELLTAIGEQHDDEVVQAVRRVLEFTNSHSCVHIVERNANCVSIRVKAPDAKNPVSIAWLNPPRAVRNYGETGFDATFGSETYERTNTTPPPARVFAILRDWSKECYTLPVVQKVEENEWAETYSMSYVDLSKASHLQAVCVALEGVIMRLCSPGRT